jgi:hypothetical protein
MGKFSKSRIFIFLVVAVLVSILGQIYFLENGLVGLGSCSDTPLRLVSQAL